MFSGIVAAKIFLVPVLLYLISLASKAWGPLAASIFTGMPVLSAPVSLITTLEQGTGFGVQMAYSALPGTLACVFNYLIYARLAMHMRWQYCFPATLVCHTGFAALLHFFPHDLLLATATACIAPFIGMRLLPKAYKTPVSRLNRHSTPWLRMFVGMAAMLVETGAASLVGPYWSGIIMVYPVLSSIVGLFTHIEYGRNAVAYVYRGIMMGMPGTVMFAVVVAWCLPHHSVATTYALAAVATLLSSFLSALLLKTK